MPKAARAMPFEFFPAVYVAQIWKPLPRPVTALRIQETWDSERLKIPGADGDLVLAQSRNGVDISLSGQLGLTQSTIPLSEAAMWDALVDLRDWLNTTGDRKFHLCLFADWRAGVYRHFRNCSTLRFEYDLSSPTLYTYQAVIHAENPVLHEQLP